MLEVALPTDETTLELAGLIVGSAARATARVPALPLGPRGGHARRRRFERRLLRRMMDTEMKQQTRVMADIIRRELADAGR